jgi:hypothetical protein
LLLDGAERVVEEPRLRPVVVEGGREEADEIAVGFAAGRGEEAAPDGLVGLQREALVEGVGRVLGSC